MKWALIIAGSVLLAGCTTTKEEKPKPNPSLTLIAPQVPADIRARYARRVPAPENPQRVLTQEQIADLIGRLVMSEEEKIKFLTRLIRIIDDQRTAVLNPQTSTKLRQELDKLTQPAQ